MMQVLKLPNARYRYYYYDITFKTLKPPPNNLRTTPQMASQKELGLFKT